MQFTESNDTLHKIISNYRYLDNYYTRISDSYLRLIKMGIFHVLKLLSKVRQHIKNPIHGSFLLKDLLGKVSFRN